MAIYAPPEVEAPRQTSPRRSGGWLRRFWQRVRLALDGDDETLLVENTTLIGWYVYHNYHQLGIIDAEEQRTFRLVKRGELSVRPYLDRESGEHSEYLVLPLSMRVKRVCICRRRMGKELEVYDMHTA